jgi:serine/threonine protein kinase
MSTQKEKLVIKDEENIVLGDVEILDVEEGVESKKESILEDISQVLQIKGGEDKQENQESDDSEEEESSDDSEVMHTSDEEEDEDGDEDGEDGDKDEDDDEYDDEDDDEEDDEDEEEDEEDEDDVFLYIHKIPAQVLVLEKCEHTLDYLMENDLLSTEELESVMFQIVTILYTYQKVFQFTHNDLHTNNIMYVNTEQTHLTYRIMGKVYKIPTFGKIYKIIDFGRAIYTYKEKLLCSDSFSTNGTAHTQYNFGPYYNAKKPVIEPNYSFDLCRLACSIFDFICDDINHIKTYRKDTPIYDLIFSWLYDDNGRNMLYRSNGDDKYPGFKLYKMISKIVHGHLPEKQYDHSCFKKFLVEKEEDIKDDSLVDIDWMELKGGKE